MIYFRRRWTHWWVAAIAVPHYAALALACWMAPERTRLWAPLLVPAGYWVLATIANWRWATVRATGVRLTLRPFPVGGGHWLPRAAIAHCYARHIVETDESESYETANYFAVGVETTDGRQFDLHLPYPTEAEALAAAAPVAATLGGVPVRTAEARHSYPSALRATVLWLAIAAGAVAAGYFVNSSSPR